jgi:lactoylglutathione lyase
MSDPATAGFVFNHTMLRVKDLDASLDFYTRVLGFTPVDRREFPQWAFTLQFLALGVDPASIPAETQARRNWMAGQPGLLELTHNHGTETDPAFAYHDGNKEPRGFGHICVSVPDIAAACARFEELGVAFQKRLGEGGMKSIAFIKDPDGYWIEIIQLTSVAA